jgi:hypothetical protein
MLKRKSVHYFSATPRMYCRTESPFPHRLYIARFQTTVTSPPVGVPLCLYQRRSCITRATKSLLFQGNYKRITARESGFRCQIFGKYGENMWEGMRKEHGLSPARERLDMACYSGWKHLLRQLVWEGTDLRQWTGEWIYSLVLVSGAAPMRTGVLWNSFRLRRFQSRTVAF